MLNLPLNALRVFTSVVCRGSFRAAADELCVSQSAVSHQIKHLEEWFGSPLFDRTGQTPKPLPHAEKLAATLQTSLSEIVFACQQARGSSGPQTLVIAAIPSVSVCWLIPRLPDFSRQHPEISIRVIYAFHGQEIPYRDVDLAFIFADGLPSNIGTKSHAFLPGRSVPVCSPHLFDTSGSKTLKEGFETVGLLHDSDLSGWEAWFSRSGYNFTSPLTGPIFEDFNLLRAAALAGQGIALCPLAMIDSDLQTGRLVLLSDISVNETFNYYLVQSTICDASKTRTIELFRKWLFDALGTELSDPTVTDEG